MIIPITGRSYGVPHNANKINERFTANEVIKKKSRREEKGIEKIKNNKQNSEGAK